MAYAFEIKSSDDILQMKYDEYVYRFEPSTNVIFIGTTARGRIKTFYKWDGREDDLVINKFKEKGLLT